MGKVKQYIVCIQIASESRPFSGLNYLTNKGGIKTAISCHFSQKLPGQQMLERNQGQ